MTNKQRKQVIESVNSQLINMEASAILLGENPEDYAAAIVGVITHPRISVAYLRSKVIAELMRINKWNYDEAVEWYEYNTERGVAYESADRNPPTLINDIEE